MTGTRVVVALGGNALLRRGESAEAETQRRNVLEAASALASVATRHELVVTHGNGPQVGLLALEADAYKAVSPYPLDVLGAESQGMIGYLLVQALQERASGSRRGSAPHAGRRRRRGSRVFASDQADRPGLLRAGSARARARARLDDRARRNVLPSRRSIAEAQRNRRAGGDRDARRERRGRRVRRRRRRAGRERARQTSRSRGSDRQGLDRGAPRAGSRRRASRARNGRLVRRDRLGYERRRRRSFRPLRATSARMQFAAGSMAPKIEAACRFVEHTGCSAAIGSLAELEAVIQGHGRDADRLVSHRTCDCVVTRSRLLRIADGICDVRPLGSYRGRTNDYRRGCNGARSCETR